MKEIGGYFEIEQTKGNSEYYKDLIGLNTARNALLYILKAKNISKIYIPYFLCDTVYKLCIRENYDFEYYHIDENFKPIFYKKLNDNEYLYLVNYYGQFSNKEILEFKEKFQNIIVDNVQAFYQKPIKNIDTIYSCRKFFGVPDGAYLSTNKYIIDLPIDNSEDRTKHLYGRLKDGASKHYQEFKDNEELFYELPLMRMSNLTHKLLKNIDYVVIKRKREKNFNYLNERLKKINKLKVKDIEGPYTYPFYTDNGLFIKKILIENKIYVATLWPNVDEGYEKEMAENILPLPCDQRYDLLDMEKICELIYEYLK